MQEVEYLYYLYGVNQYSAKDVENIFTNGILSYKGNNLLHIAEELEIDEALDYDLPELLAKECQDKYEAVYVIKIPKFFYKPEIDNRHVKHVPLPVWKSVNKKDDNVSITSLFTPKLVYGIYHRETKAFFENFNYENVHDPVGLEYDENQIKYFNEEDCLSWSRYASSRSYKSSQYLYNSDTANHVWENAVDEYQNYFTESHTKKI